MLMRRRGTDLGDNPNYRRETASCVETTYHTDLKEVAGGFVADVQMAYRIGEQIRKFKKIEHLAYKVTPNIGQCMRYHFRRKLCHIFRNYR